MLRDFDYNWQTQKTHSAVRLRKDYTMPAIEHTTTFGRFHPWAMRQMLRSDVLARMLAAGHVPPPIEQLSYRATSEAILHNQASRNGLSISR
jgi:hypothetical protein